MTQGATRPFIMAAIATAATLAGIGGYAFVESHRPAILELFVFGVPGNPAIFIRTPNDRRILINGGANSEIVERITGILPFYSRRIDTVIATNDDPKNVTGLVDVINRYSVDKVVIPAVSLQSLGLASSSDPIYETFLAAVDSHKIPVQEVEAGQRLVFDEPVNQLSGNSNSRRSVIDQLTSRSIATSPVRQSDVPVNDPVIADILFPLMSEATSSFNSNSNTASTSEPVSTSSAPFKYSKASAPEILMRINYGATSFMLMGDASIKVQKFIATENRLPSDTLIISTSATASNLALQLVDSLAPEYLVYSASPAKKGSVASKSAVSSTTKLKADPLAGILNENRFNVREKGTVKLVSDGVSMKISD